MSAEANRSLALFGLFLFAVFALHFINYAPDDAWISLRYAENLANGEGLVFNPGERVEGYSNFLWVLLMALFANIPDKYFVTLIAKGLGILCGVLAVMYIGRIAEHFPASEGSEKYKGLAPLALGFYGYAAFWSASGMETGFYLLLVTLAMGAHLRWVQGGGIGWGVLSSVAFLAVALTRPEGILFFGAALLAELFTQTRKIRALPISAVLWIALVVVGYGAFFLWRHAYFGQWWPNTFYAKTGGGMAEYAEGARYLLLNLPAFTWSNPVLLLFLALPFAGRAGFDRKRVFLGLCIVGQAAFAVYAGGDWMGGARFLVPAMPAAALLVPAAAEEVRRRLTGRRTRIESLVGRTLLVLLIAGIAAVHLYNAKQIRHDVSGFRAYDGARFFKPDHFMIATYLDAETGPDDLIALGEAGLIPYLTDLPALDLFGLMDPYLARLPGLRHQKFDADYVFAKDPDYIVLGGCKIWSDLVTSDFEYARALLADERLAKRYDRAFSHHTFLVFKRKPLAG